MPISDGYILGITEADIRLELAEEDSAALDEGVMSAHEVTPAAMVMELLDIEEAQCVHSSPPRRKTNITLAGASSNRSTPNTRAMVAPP